MDLVLCDKNVLKKCSVGDTLDIKEILNGEYFAMFINPNTITEVVPHLYDADGWVFNGFLPQYTDVNLVNTNLPFLFRKIDEEHFQELTSGVIINCFKIDDFSNFSEEKYQKLFRVFKELPLIIRPSDMPDVYPINDVIKFGFGKRLLSSDATSKMFTEMQQKALENFDNSFKDVIAELETMATTDNFLYDLENKLSRKREMKK